MYEDLKEYLNWYDTRRDVKFAKDAPIIGLVLQRSHLVTGDEGHYSGVVAGLEARGAKVKTPTLHCFGSLGLKGAMCHSPKPADPGRNELTSAE